MVLSHLSGRIFLLPTLETVKLPWETRPFVFVPAEFEELFQVMTEDQKWALLGQYR